MFALAVVLIAADLAPPPSAEPGFVLRRPTADPVVKLLQQERIDEALAAAGPHAYSPWVFRESADQAAAAGKTADALCYYEAFLRHASPDSCLQPDWGVAAVSYVELLGRAEGPRAGWFRQSRESAGDYLKLADAYGADDAGGAARLADGIVARHPRGLFAVPAAVLAVSPGRVTGRPVPADGFVRRLRAAGASDADLLLLRMQGFEVPGHAATEEEAAEVARLAPGPLTRREALRFLLGRRIEKYGALVGDWAGARAAGAAVVGTYAPTARPLGRARMLQAYRDDPPSIREIERWLDDWRRAGERFDEGAAYAVLASRYAFRDSGRAAALFAQSVAAPTEDRAGRAHARMRLAAYLSENGDDARRVLILAGADPTDLDPENNLHADYARVFDDWGDHARALVYWERWRPVSDGICGNGLPALQAGRLQRITECRAKLGKP